MSWQRIRGHEALTRSFQHVIRRGRLAHSYLFVGPPGVGKRLFATELARALLCERPDADQALDGCDVCSSCRQIDAETHPDYAYFRKPDEKHEFPVELMREVCDQFALKSARGKGRVIVLDDADDFNEESANCFLKTLEEPPARSLLILVVRGTERQYPTIVSRCQVVQFGRLADADVSAILKADGIDDPALLARVLRAAEGSPGVARELAEPAVWEFRERMLKAFASLPLNSHDLSKEWWAFIEAAGKESRAQRQRASYSIGILLTFLKGALQLALSGSSGADSDPVERRAMEAVAHRLDAERLLNAMERCLEAEAHVERRVQLVLALEALSDSLAGRLATAE